jgi:hypothetical protein
MELRWYQTYDKHGVESEPVLQFREYERISSMRYSEWEEVEFVRERDPDADLTPQYED